MDIGRILRNGWELFIRDIGPLIIGGLIAMILSVLSLFILAGPLFGGLYLMIVRRVREGRPAEFGDVFACFDRFGTLFLAFWGAGLLILLGLALLIVPGVYLIVIWVYLLPLIVDKRIGVSEAMSRSKEMVMKGGFWMHFAALLVVCILTGVASSVTGGVGNLLTVPFTIAFVVAMYFVASGEGDLVDAACWHGHIGAGGEHSGAAAGHRGPRRAVGGPCRGRAAGGACRGRAAGGTRRCAAHGRRPRPSRDSLHAVRRHARPVLGVLLRLCR